MRLRKKRGFYKKPKWKARHHIGHRLPELKWYWGKDEDWGVTFCAVRTETNPHLSIHKIRERCLPGYCGFDPERNRFVIRPWDDKGLYTIGWRKKVYPKSWRGYNRKL